MEQHYVFRHLNSPGAFVPAPPGGGDPHFANVVFLIGNESGADGTSSFVDQSSNGWTVTAVGTAQWDDDAPVTPTGLTSWVQFPFSSDSALEIADNAAMEMGSGEWTFEGFFQKQGTGTTLLLASKGDFGTNRCFRLFVDSTDALHFFLSVDGSNFGVTMAGGNAVIPATLTQGVVYYFRIRRSAGGSYDSHWSSGGPGSALTAGGTASNATAVANSTGNWCFGSDESRNGDFNGHAGPFRFTKAFRTDTVVPSLPFPNS